jgi:hypothetical protein
MLRQRRVESGHEQAIGSFASNIDSVRSGKGGVMPPVEPLPSATVIGLNHLAGAAH